MDELSVASINICGGRGHVVKKNNANYAIDYLSMLAELNDVVCVQEVVNYKGEPEQRFMAMKNPGHFNSPIDLKLVHLITTRLKKSHHLWFNCHFTGGFHDYQSTSLPVSFGNLMIAKKTLPINGQCLGYPIYGNYGLSTQTKVGNKGRAAARTAQVLSINHKDGAIFVENIHGLHSLTGKGDSSARGAQSAAIAQAIVKHRAKRKILTDPRTIAIGDYNYLADQAAMHQLTSRVDAFGLGGAVNLNTHGREMLDGRTRFYPGDKPTRQAGHTLVSLSLLPHVVTYEMWDDDVPSDHKVMFLRLSLRKMTNRQHC